MEERYNLIKEKITNEIVIEKSIFICNLIPINSKEEADYYLKEINKEHYKATHNCYAYTLYNPITLKSSDDGEPSGTAGIPILEVLRKNNLYQVLAVVTRYFGGVKLGAGGLVRAYTNATAKAIEKAKIFKSCIFTHYEIEFTYDLISFVDKFMSQNNIKCLNKEFDINVKYLFYLEDETLYEKLNQFVNGKLKLVNTYESELIV